MIKKITLAVLFFILLSSCNYKPIYSSKNLNFSLGKIETAGDAKINKLIVKELEIYKNNETAKVIYDLDITSDINKRTVSKDKKGNPTVFALEISYTIKAKNNLKVFKENTIYDNDENKFNLKRYESSIKKNMIRDLSEKIVLYLQELN